MSEKQTIAILCGGQSPEHVISILSAQNVSKALDPTQYTSVVIYLSQQGAWYQVDPSKKNYELQKDRKLVLVPGQPKKPFALASDPTQSIAIDCVIPMLHGANGEDGTMQGLLDLLGVPYVGAGVIGSAICMQKLIAKRLLRFAGLPTSDWVCIEAGNVDEYSYEVLANELGQTFFVKPSALGSSIGISKVRNANEYKRAIRDALQYDDQVIVERAIKGREIECSVLGNDKPVASLPGELITSHDFYSYDAKYHDPSLKIETPADIPEAAVKIIQELAVKAFETLQCRGMARVDFFLTEGQEAIINEVNTIPGFTDVSMYPKNWEASGLTYSDLLEDLIQLAQARHHHRSGLSHFYLAHSDQVDTSSSLGKTLE
ncbi:MAG: D-alanine--D-alanine ligase [Coxiellaceae bacterium]|nr:D-alanine--D-alanine ligase [Coxiellaceae bacterium]